MEMEERLVCSALCVLGFAAMVGSFIGYVIAPSKGLIISFGVSLVVMIGSYVYLNTSNRRLADRLEVLEEERAAREAAADEEATADDGAIPEDGSDESVPEE